MSTSSSYAKFGVVFCIYVAYVLFRRLPIALLPQIRTEIPVSNDAIGRIVSIHAAACTVSKLVFGTASDRTSNSRLLIGGLLLCCTSSIFLAFANVIWQFDIVMAMIGAVQGAGWIPATKLIGTWFSNSSYATMFSLLGCGSTVAGILLPLFKILYWRTTELTLALFMIMFAILCKKWIISEDSIVKRIKSAEENGLQQNQQIRIRLLIGSPIIWHIAFIYFFSMEMRTICETWMPLYLNERHASSNVFQFFYEIGGLMGTILSGILLDKLAERMGVDSSRRFLGVFFTIAMMLISMGIFTFNLSSIFGFLVGFFVNGSINIWCLIGSQACDKSVAGTASAFISFIASVGSVIAGTPFAYLIDHFSFHVFTILFIIQIAFVLLISSFRIPLRMEDIHFKSKSN